MQLLNGNDFIKMVVSGANQLDNQRVRIDALNVFPVPDGDTGTNMSMTFRAGANEIKDLQDEPISVVAKKLSKGLLMGARGNSGVILSQIFRGFAMGVEGLEAVDASQLAHALKNGAAIAYKAVMRPVEGTILTVIREGSDATGNYSSGDLTIEEIFKYFLAACDKSLQHTPELLPVLKEVGVVDSGGAGLLEVFKGFDGALNGKPVELAHKPEEAQPVLAVAGTGEEGYGYCTEFIIRLEDNLVETFSEQQLKKELARIPGESIVCVQDENIVKVHVHTLKPGDALNLAQRFGEFLKIKIENMQEQADHLGNTIVGVDDKTATAKHKEVALIAVAAGEGVEKAFRELHCDAVVAGGQTMNPSTESLVTQIKKLNADNVIVLPNNSNIVMTANQAAQVLEGQVNVIVIPTKTIPQGLSACVMYNPDDSLDNNLVNMEEAKNTVKTGQVTFAIKDTNIDGVDIVKDEHMAICQGKIIASDPDRLEALKKTLVCLVDEQENELITLIVGQGVNDHEITEIESYIEDNFDLELDIINGQQPVYSFIVGVE